MRSFIVRRLKSKGYRRKEVLPKKSSFRKRRTKLRVKWSPDVRQIERKVSVRKSKVSATDFLVKVNQDKTETVSGKLYAEFVSPSNVLLTIMNRRKKCVLSAIVNPSKKKMLDVERNNYKYKNVKHGSHRVRTKLRCSDVIWKENGMKFKRACSHTGYDISWLNKIHEFHATKHYKGSQKSSSKINRHTRIKSKRRSNR